jgi:ParB family chromosome partitioning protein
METAPMILIPLSQIERNPNQPRETFPQEHIERLAASIKKRGLIQPITVRPIGSDRYQIVAGECRFRAHQLLAAATIKAEVVEIGAEEMQLQAIVENLQRQDMNPIEEARAFKTLLDNGYDVARVVDELGLNSTAIVSQRLNLLNLTAEIQGLVASGNLPVTMAWGIALVSKDRQAQLVRDIASGKLRTAEQVKHAGIALREAEQQLDAFGSAPAASHKDIAVISRLDAKIDAIAAMVQLGFKDGECVAAQRVSSDRVKTMADKLSLIRKHVLQMEHDLRRVATQTEIKLASAAERANSDEGAIDTTTVGPADRGRAQRHREPDVDGHLSRPDPHSRRPKAARAADPGNRTDVRHPNPAGRAAVRRGDRGGGPRGDRHAL